jgi:hypothetical protein
MNTRLDSTTFAAPSARDATPSVLKNHLADWRAFAAAAGAGLAAASAADAAIIYTDPSSKPVANSGNFQTNIAIGSANVRLFAGSSAGGAWRTNVIGISNKVGVAHGTAELFATSHVFRTTNRNAKLFANGQLIGSTGKHGTFKKNYAGLRSHIFSAPNTHTGGNFLTGKTGFAGFDLPDGDLGWIRLEISSNGSGLPDTITAIDWAYNDVAGATITGGQTGAVPEPSALGLLAMGSAGVLAWRKRRNAAAA